MHHVEVDYQWFDFDDNSQGAPFNYSEDRWELTVSALDPAQPFVGPFDLSYSYTDRLFSMDLVLTIMV